MAELNIDISKYKKQEEFILDKHFGVGFIGGWGSGKTYGGGIKALKYCLENPYACGLIIGPNYGILERAILPTYEAIFPPEIIKKRTKRPPIKWVGKKSAPFVLYFCSADKPENLACGEIAFSHIDEGSKSPLMSYRFMRSRMRLKKPDGTNYPYQFWVTTTPKQLNWVYKEIIVSVDPNITCYVASTLENRWLNESGFDSKDDAGILAYIERTGMVEGTEEYKQNILGEAVILSGECLFRAESLDRQLQYCDEPIEIRNNGAIIYHEYVPGERYVAAADCSDEGGGGANCMIIQDPQTGKEMAEIYTEKSAGEFSELCFDLLGEYHNPVFAPERNGTVGGMVIEKFRGMGYPNLFKDHKGRDGWYTVTGTALPPAVGRFTMLKEYEEAVRTRQTIIHSSDAIGEMSTFVRDSSGKYKCIQGCKDDRIMARAICWQLRKVKPITPIKFGSFKRHSSTYA